MEHYFSLCCRTCTSPVTCCPPVRLIRPNQRGPRPAVAVPGSVWISGICRSGHPAASKSGRAGPCQAITSLVLAAGEVRGSVLWCRLQLWLWYSLPCDSHRMPQMHRTLAAVSAVQQDASWQNSVLSHHTSHRAALQATFVRPTASNQAIVRGSSHSLAPGRCCRLGAVLQLPRPQQLQLQVWSPLLPQHFPRRASCASAAPCAAQCAWRQWAWPLQ